MIYLVRIFLTLMTTDLNNPCYWLWNACLYLKILVLSPQTSFELHLSPTTTKTSKKLKVSTMEMSHRNGWGDVTFFNLCTVFAVAIQHYELSTPTQNKHGRCMCALGSLPSLTTFSSRPLRWELQLPCWRTTSSKFGDHSCWIFCNCSYKVHFKHQQPCRI